MAQRILLTGATGAIGPQLVAELLASDPTTRIDAILRPGESSVARRFAPWREIVAELGATDDALRRVRPIAGDMRTDTVIADRAEVRELLDETDVILHAAADTRFRDCPDAQWDINVEGTRRMIDLARRCRKLRRFVFVSTTCVAGAATGLIRETALSDPPQFLNHYERTKWEAEQLVLASGLPACAVRVSVVMGSERTGAVHRPGALHRVLRWYRRGLLPLFPGAAGATVDLISTELAARCLAKATMLPFDRSDIPRIVHVALGRHALPLTDLVPFVWNYPIPGEAEPADRRSPMPRVVDRDRFEDFRRSLDPKSDALLARVMESVESFLPGMLFHPKTFDTSEAERLWGGPLPLADCRQTLGRVLTTCCVRTPAEPSAKPLPPTRSPHRPRPAAALISARAVL